MNLGVLSVVLIPFLGTAIGAGFVFFLKGKMNRKSRKAKDAYYEISSTYEYYKDTKFKKYKIV